MKPILLSLLLLCGCVAERPLKPYHPTLPEADQMSERVIENRKEMR